MAGAEQEKRRCGQGEEEAMVQHERPALRRGRCGASPANNVVVGLLPYVHGRLAKKPPFWMDGRRTSGPPSSLCPPAHAYSREELESPHSPSTGAAGCLIVPSVLSPRRGALRSVTHNAHRRHTSAHRGDGLCFSCRAGGGHRSRHWRSFRHRGGSSTTFHRSTPVTHLSSPV